MTVRDGTNQLLDVKIDDMYVIGRSVANKSHRHETATSNVYSVRISMDCQYEQILFRLKKH